jgi:plastocyanin
MTYGTWKTGLALALAVIAGSAQAGRVTATVLDSNGARVGNAVVTLVPIGSKVAAPKPINSAIVQADLQFSPYVTIVPVGSVVSFPNKDGIQHHVRSFSSAKDLNFKVATEGEPEKVTFDKLGVVPLHCLLHDWMRAFVYVVDTPYFSKTEDTGQASMVIPNGEYELSVWHPDFGAVRPIMKQKITSTDATNNVNVKFDFVPRKQRKPRPDAASNYGG